MRLEELNSLDRDTFVGRIGFVYEKSPWIADAAFDQRPWSDVAALAASLKGVVDSASTDAQEALLRAHPDLAGRELAEGTLTQSSRAEQTSVGLDGLDAARRTELQRLAAAYKERFGFPCIICVREAGSADAILAATERRLRSSRDVERRTAIEEVHKIARLRLLDTVRTNEAVELLRALVRAPSENPPGDERAVQSVVLEYLAGIPGVTVERIEAAPDRPIVVATLAGARPGRTLIFGGHVDTVPAGDGWTRDPFGGEIAGGRLFGRGAADMKSGVAGFLAALRRLAGMRDELAGTIVVHVVPDEEPGGQLGSHILHERGMIRGDAAVIAEPSGLCVHRAQKGNVFARLRTAGKSAHGSMPAHGENAISKALRLALDLEDRLGPRLAEREHPLVGSATISVGTIHGGVRTNVVPDECVVTIDRRIVPGEREADVLRELESFVGGRAQIEYEHVGAAFETPEEHWLVQAATRLVDEVHGRRMPIGGLVGSSDARFYAAGAAIPTIILGPGTMDEAHVSDESVEVELVEKSVDLYAKLAAELLAPASD
jgi:succinyl-diaminopimelate desuccinylase